MLITTFMAARRPKNEANLRRQQLLDRLCESEGPESSEGPKKKFTTFMAARRPKNEANLRRQQLLDRLGESEGPDSSEGHKDNSAAFFGEACNHRNGAGGAAEQFQR